MSIILYKVKEHTVIPCEDNPLNPENIYIIVAKTQLRPKIWVWSGPKSNLQDRYFAGVSATTIKSHEKLYGSSIEVVEGGSEPDQFPKFDKVQIVKASEIEVPVVEKERFPPEVITEPIAPSTESKTTLPEPAIEQPPVESVAESVIEPEKIEEKATEIPSGEEAMVSTPAYGRKKPAKKAGKGDLIFNEKLKSLLKELSLGLESLKAKVEAFLGEL